MKGVGLVNKKEYVEVRIVLTYFDSEDLITTSGGVPDNEHDPNGWA
jgi:hypothetical protein